MSFMDKLKGSADSLRKGAGKQVNKHGDKIAGGLDKAGDTINKKTGGKYADKVEKGKGAAKSGLNKLDDKKDGPPTATS